MHRKLALLGGTPARELPLPAYNTIGSEEKSAVMRVLDSGELSGFVATPDEYFWGGREVRALERDFCERYGVKHAISVNSATSGLHCAVWAMDTGPGDEVIVPPYTMSATATAVLMTGAVPIFADIEDDYFCLSPESVAANITPRTKGIIAVNLFGHPAALTPLKDLAEKHGLFLVEDNAQAPDATYHGTPTGTIGDAGVFSLNRHKTMQCGEGGILLTNDDMVAKKASMFRNHGEVVVEAFGVNDIVNTAGLNYRMTEMEAAVGQCQLAKLGVLNEYRIQLAAHLTKRLNGIEGLTPPKVSAGCSHVYYVYPMKFDDEALGMPRDLFAKAMTAEGFPLRPGYVEPLYRQPLYQKKLFLGRDGFPFSANANNENLRYGPEMCPITETLQNQSLLMANIVYPPLNIEDMDHFADVCEEVIDQRDTLLGWNNTRSG
jgi:perosamine synthetase